MRVPHSGLRTLRDLGFGRRSIEKIINGEVEEIIAKICGQSECKDYLVGSDFNIPVVNVLWQLVAGTRFDAADSRDCDIVTTINTVVFKNYFFLISFPLGLTKLMRRSFFEENLRVVRNQHKYILGKGVFPFENLRFLMDWLRPD